jgi:hypothetical protein
MAKKLRVALQARVTKAATCAGTAFVSPRLPAYKSMVVTLQIFSAERDSGNETYDFYITTGDKVASWDVVHFTQVVATGAKIYQARVRLDATVPLMRGTTATPGVTANDSFTFQTDTAASAEGIKTLPSGQARHGPLGDRLNYQLVIAGTVVTGIDFAISVLLG